MLVTRAGIHRLRAEEGRCAELRTRFWEIVFSPRYLNWRDETVAAPGNIDNESISILPVAQHAAQSGHMDRKVSRHDENTRPDVCHQFLLTNDFTCAIKQNDQDLQSAASKRHRFVAFEQKKLRRKEAKRSE